MWRGFLRYLPPWKKIWRRITILIFVNIIFKLRGWVLVVGAAQNFINWTVRKLNGISTTKQKFSPWYQYSTYWSWEWGNRPHPRSFKIQWARNLGPLSNSTYTIKRWFVYHDERHRFTGDFSARDSTSSCKKRPSSYTTQRTSEGLLTDTLTQF